MSAHRHRRSRSVPHLVVRGVVAATFVVALVTAGTLSFAQASSTVQIAAPAMSAVTDGPTVAELLPAPPFPADLMPELPLPTPESEEATATGDTSDHCDDPAWWQARQQGDPGDYVAACGEWPWWVDRGDTATEPDTSGAAPYSGPTEGRPSSPEYGSYEGRTDGPKNSDGEPCMQGRDNDDPNC